MRSIGATDEQMAPTQSRYSVSAFGLLGSVRRSVCLVVLREVITDTIQARTFGRQGSRVPENLSDCNSFALG